jgi:DNA-binding IclR family transcriptional regulator
MKEENAVIQSVDRALALLEYIADHPESRLSLNDFAAYMKMDKSSIYRLLSTLIKHGLVRQEENRKTYRLGFKLFNLASALYDQMKITHVASPLLREIAYKTRENAHLAVRSGTWAVFIDREQGSNLISANTNIGDTEELYCTAVGKSLICDFTLEELGLLFENHRLERYTEKTIIDLHVLKEELDKVRIQGYAVDMEEYNNNVICIAGPLYSYNSKIIAAIGISGPKDRMYLDLEKNILVVREAVREINAVLGSGVQAE